MEKAISTSKLYIVSPSEIRDADCKKTFKSDMLKQKVLFERLPSLSIAYFNDSGAYVDLFKKLGTSPSFKRRINYRNAKTLTGIFVTTEATRYIGVFPHDIIPFGELDFQQVKSSTHLSRLQMFTNSFTRRYYTIDELKELYEQLKQIEIEPKPKTLSYKVPKIPRNKVFIQGSRFDLSPIYVGSSRDIDRQFQKSLSSNGKEFRI